MRGGTNLRGRGDDPKHVHQRGVLVVDPRPVPTPVSGAGSAMCVSSGARGCHGFREGNSLPRQYVDVESACLDTAVKYIGAMPNLLNKTIAAHWSGVRDAILATTAALVAEHVPVGRHPPLRSQMF